MGWLFAVALGLQERRLRAVIDGAGADRPRPRAGHRPGRRRRSACSGWSSRSALLLALGGAALLGFAAYKVATRFRHPRWVGMRVRPRELVLWSFLMASAHGAGLMLVPVLVGLRGEGVSSALAHAGHLGHAGAPAAGGQ